MSVILLTGIMALGTILLGWWAVPVLGLIYGIWRGAGRAVAVAGGSAFGGWSLLMAWNWTAGPVWELSESLGAVMGLPGGALMLATALFPAMLASTAASVGAAVRRG